MSFMQAARKQNAQQDLLVAPLRERKKLVVTALCVRDMYHDCFTGVVPIYLLIWHVCFI